MIDLSAPADAVLQILKTYDYTSHMYDENGAEVTDPEQARRFFATLDEDVSRNLGVTMEENGDDTSINVYFGKNTQVGDIKGVADTIRTCATGFNLLYNLSRWGADIDAKNFADLGAVHEAIHHEAGELATLIIEAAREHIRPSRNRHGDRKLER